MPVELIHTHALVHGDDLRYVDEVRAFPPAPETEEIYAEAPKGVTEDPNLAARTLRRINGHRGGPKGYAERASVQLEQL
eukprot:7146188-Alexandrium_andersonii.AAC.1